MLNIISILLLKILLIHKLLSIQHYLVNGHDQVSEKNKNCPLWHVPDQHGRCVCGAHLNGKVLCESDNNLLIPHVYCLTWNNFTNEAEILNCLVTTRNTKPKCFTDKNGNYHLDRYHIPTNMSGEALNSFICNNFNRRSTHCQRCLDGYAPAPFTDGNSCFNCSEYKYLWIPNLFLQISITTVMYVLFILLQINGASSPFNVVFTYTQLALLAMRLDGSMSSIFVCVLGQRFTDVLLTGLGFFNLDFFHLFLPPSCVTTSMKAIDTLFFDYIIAIYPLCLTLFFFLCIKLHDRKSLLITVLLYPLRKVLERFHINWDPKQTILKTFTTFFLLSFSKMFLISLNLTIAVQPYNLRGKAIHNSTVLFYDPSVIAYHSRHIPYVILAISTTVFFILLPILILFFYPTHCFRKSMTLIRFRRWDILHNIMDVFQGPFKDGTEGTRDYRYFSAVYLLLRIGNGIYIVLVFFTNYNHEFTPVRWLVSALIHVFLGMLFFAIKPYKKVWMNNVDGLLLTFIGVSLIFLISSSQVVRTLIKALLPLSLLIVFVTVVYTICNCTKKCRN